MSDILLLTEISGKKADRYKAESRLRFTEPTYASLKNNIYSGKLKVAIEKYNKTYEELRSAIVSAEVAAAENQARVVATQTENQQSQVDEQKRLALIEEDEKVAKIASVGVAKRRFASLSLDVRKLSGNFGTLGNNFGVNVTKSKFLPRALSVPKFFSKIYTQILKNVDLYRLADKVDDIDPSLVGTQLENGQTPSNVPNWRKLFENTTPQKSTDVVVAMNSQPLSKDSDDEDSLDMISQQSGVSTADLSHRNLLAQINDELEDLRKLRSSPNGFTSPFDSGLEEREDNLLSMLVSISGIKKIPKKKTVVEKKNTEFQNLIENIVGYSKPLSDEEYEKKAAEMEDYYSDPEVEKTIEDLRHKDILFSFNNPESYNHVMEAERKDNERIAQKATALEVIGNEPEETDDEVVDTIVTLGAMDQAKQLKDRYEENKLLASGAEEEARRFANEDEKNRIIFGAQEQAQILAEQDERNFVINGAQEQAQMLKTLNDFMKKQAEMEKAAKEETQLVIEGAREQASSIIADEERAKVVRGAQEQANAIVANEERAKVVRGAQEQANAIIADEERAKVVRGAQEQASAIVASEEREKIILGAEEQAKNIFQSSLERSRVGNNTETEIIDINDNQSTLMEDLVSQIAYRNVIDSEIINGASETAGNIIAAEDKKIAERGALETAGNIIAMEDKKIAERGALETAGNIIAQEDRQMAVNGSLSTAANIINLEDYKIARRGGQETARNIIATADKKIAERGALETAGNIIAQEDRQMVEQQAPAQAKALFDAHMNSVKTDKSTIDLSPLKCVTLDTNDRYCSFIHPSRPLKLRASQKENFDKRMSSRKTNSIDERKKALTTLREQLSNEEFDFLRYDESVMGNKAKVA